MKKVLRFSIPLILASLLLGITIHLAIASAKVTAVESTRKGTQGELVVTTLADELNNDGDCSLREAISAANTNASVDACPAGDVLTDTITFDVAGIITVTSQFMVSAGGPLVIDGGNVITTSGGGTTRVWWVDTGSDFTLQNLSIVNGFDPLHGAGLFNHISIVSIINCTLSENIVGSMDPGHGGGLLNEGTMTIANSTFSSNSVISFGYGGGIFNYGNLAIDNSLFSGNNANDYGGGISNMGTLTIARSIFSGNNAYSYDGGGGIYNDGDLTITNTVFISNHAHSDGGGIYNHGTLTITDSLFSGNIADEYGGGIYNWENMTISSSTFSSNNGGSGGAINNRGVFTITNSTFSGNIAQYSGGGIRINYGDPTIADSTFSSNSAVNGGGVYNLYGSLTITNSILANSLAGGDCSGAIIDGGHNLDSDGTCGLDPANGSLPNTDPLLGPFQDNGGPTWTRALLPNSPAIDAGDDTQCPPTDQRGVYRPLDGNGDGLAVCDMGSYEFEPGHLIVTTLADELNNDGDCSLREAVQAANANALVDTCGSGGVLTDTITFDIAGIITVTSQLSVTAGGLLQVDGGNVITTSGGLITRVWWVEVDSNLSLHHLAVVNGLSNYGGAGLYNNSGNVLITDTSFSGNVAYNGGGGIYTDGSLSITNSSFYGNSAITLGGGAITNNGHLTITNSSFFGNSADTFGGGIDNFWTLTITKSTFSENIAGLSGGGIFSNFYLTIDNSTFSGNHAYHGGGVTGGTIYINNSTFSGNTAVNEGGGVQSLCNLNIYNSTFSGNTASNGGGINHLPSDPGCYESITNSTLSGNNAYAGGGIYDYFGSLILANTIVADNPTGGDCNDAIIDGGHNLDSDGTCGLDPANGSLPNTDPQLGPLQNNSGPTLTHALLPNSPAIDAGDNAQCTAVDQRGVPRPLDGNNDGVTVCDIGAYEKEYQPVSPGLVTISGESEVFVGQEYIFTATVEPISTTQPLTYTWQADGQPPITHINGLTDTVSFIWILPGNQDITVATNNNLGAVSTSHGITISDVPISGLSASNNSPNLLGDSTIFTAVITSGTNVIFDWDFGDGLSGSGVIIAHTYLNPGIFTATITATNSANTTTDTTLVTIIDPLHPVYLPLVIKSNHSSLFPSVLVPGNGLPGKLYV